MRTILLSLTIFGIVALAAHAGETTGAQYADPLGLPVVLDNSGGAGISVGVKVQPATGSSSSGKRPSGGKRLVPAASFADGFPDRSPGSGDPGIGSGLWVPPGTTNRIVADPSHQNMSGSYVPGCLNRQFAKDGSSGCAANTSYTGTIAGTTISRTVTMGSGKELVLRYKTPAAITDGKTIKVLAWNGGSVGYLMRTWLSKDPATSYESVTSLCRAESTVAPIISTASRSSVTTTTTAWGVARTTTGNYCKLEPNTVYYYGIQYFDAASRFIVDEMSSDFLK